MRVLSRIPPPFLFAGALLLGALLQRLRPLPLAAPGLLPVAHGVGAVLVGLGGVLLVRCVFLFRRNRTTVHPTGKPSTLIAAWPYTITRNPIYVGFTLVGLGVAGITGSLWMVLVLAIPLTVLQTTIIPMEERNLTGIFGDEYRAYQQRVRRWI